MTDQQELLTYYQSELAYLRQMGKIFAQDHPHLAARLELSDHECADPHVERLIESFAFLTARIQRRLDAEFPEISSALLGVLYPHLVQPVPPMAIAHFQADPTQGKLTTGLEIPKHSRLVAQAEEGLSCRFRTCYPVTLWPLQVVSAAFQSKDGFDFLDGRGDVACVLRLRLTASQGKLSDLPLKSLRFYLNGEMTTATSVYELLFSRMRGIVLWDGKAPLRLPENSILPVGFAEDEEAIPYPPQSHPGYRLVQEYFAFSRKFLFFDLVNLDRRQSEQALDILFLLDQPAPRNLALDRQTFLLGCTPMVNLFSRTSEPIRLDHRQSEYRLVADIYRERTTEIHSIQSVIGTTNPAEGATVIEPFFSFRHRMDGTEPRCFWHARRVPFPGARMAGTEMFVSFLDLDLNPQIPAVQTVYANILCTNRDLAAQMQAGAFLDMEDAAPVAQIRCLTKPTPPAYPPLQGKTLWALISNLSLNYLSLTEGKESLRALKEMLRLYSFSADPAATRQIESITEMNCRPVVRRFGKHAWRGFCQGTEVTLTFDEKCSFGAAFLLASALQSFFALYTSVNSFAQLVICRTHREGECKRRPLLTGEQLFL